VEPFDREPNLPFRALLGLIEIEARTALRLMLEKPEVAVLCDRGGWLGREPRGLLGIFDD
jgi:hypothetical protein